MKGRNSNVELLHLDLFFQLVEQRNYFVQVILLNDQYQLDVDLLIIDIDQLRF